MNMESKYVRQNYLNSTKNGSNKDKTGSEEQYERIQNIGSVIVSSGSKKLYALTMNTAIDFPTYMPPSVKNMTRMISWIQSNA